MEKGEIKNFSVSYVSEIAGKAASIMRYDCAHGFLHKDICYKKPMVKEKVIRELNGELVNEIQKEIEGNWRKYKEWYIKNYCKGD